jgi:N-acetylmuramoyl-L-alanine amidase
MRWTNQNEVVFGAAALLCCAVLVLLTAPESSLTATSPPLQAASVTASQPSGDGDTRERGLPEFFVMIDPSHGGDDKGSVFGGKHLEKDFTLSLARALRKELEGRGIAARLLRDSDVNLSLERRAEVTNEQHAVIYIALHAGPLGKGVRVYMPMLPFAHTPATGRFLPWESAQAPALDRSEAVARTVTAELRKTDLHVVTLAAPLRPLNNVVAPAIAVEWAPGTEGRQSLENQKLENTLASALASGIAKVRGQMGERP